MKYNLTGLNNFYGSKERRNLLDIKPVKVEQLIQYLAIDLDCEVVFIYNAIDGVYLGSYSRKYQNYKSASNGKLYETFPF